MADSDTDKKITLYFVKNANHQFGPVEKFLAKRGYSVRVQSNISGAIEEIKELNPDYIFLAWDHKNEAIRQMPKTLYASCTGQIVPFIMSTQRDQIIQLESSGFENKLYPPLSGPAIIRVISKYEKKNQAFEQINTKKTVAKKESDMIQVKSFFNDETEQKEINMRRSASLTMADEDKKMVASRSRGHAQMFARNNARKNRPLNSIKQDGTQAKLMTAMASEIDNSPLLSATQKQNTKNNLMAAIEREFAKSGTQKSLMLAIEDEVDRIAELNPDEQIETKAKLIALLDGELKEAFPEIEDEEPLKELMSELLPKEAKKLSKGQQVFLEESFKDTIKPEMFDLIETYSDLTDNQTTLTEISQIFVLAIQEMEWTGYLTVASENYLDGASAQVILNNWIKQMIKIERIDQKTDTEAELPDSVLFEMRIPKINFADFCSYKAEFFREVEYEGKKTMLGFFSFSPFQVINSVHEAHDMLELSTGFLQPNKNLPFDVNLYLPENKRFLLYLKPGSFLDDAQVSRLQTRKVEYIYSNVEYELSLLKYKAEFNLQGLIESYNRIKGSKE